MYSWSLAGFLSSINMTFSSGSQQGVCVHVTRVQSLTQHFPGPALLFLHVSVSHTPCEVAPGGCSSPYPCHRSSSLDRRVLCGKTFLSHTPRGGPRKSSQVRSPPRSGRERLEFHPVLCSLTLFAIYLPRWGLQNYFTQWMNKCFILCLLMWTVIP